VRHGDAFERFAFAASAKRVAAAGSVLQPVLYAPVAAWALLDDDDGSSPTMVAPINVDRVTGAYPLTRTQGTVSASADLIKQYRCAYGGASARPLGRDDGAGGGVEAALKLSGELTISMRAWWTGGTTVAFPTLVDVSEGWPARNASNGQLQCFYRLTIDTAAGGKVIAYHQRAAGGYSYADYVWTSSLAMEPGKWTYLALRRSAAGAYTVNVDAAQVTGPATPLPNPAYGAGALNLGQWGSAQIAPGNLYVGADPWQGGLADVMIWDKRLTDAQVLNQRAVMFDVAA
jgi:hypothetical protein